ncbi:unnamed protein product, partial [marine sediment metagenome]
VTGRQFSGLRVYVGAVSASLIAMEVSACLVPIQAGLSGVLVVPLPTFLLTMLSVHLLIGLVEGLITVAVLRFLQQVRPDIVVDSLPGKIRWNKKAVLITLVVFTFVMGAGLSQFASEFPDGLEWSYADRPDQPNFEKIVTNKDSTVAAVEDFQDRYSLIPDYSLRSSSTGKTGNTESDISAGWTSFAGTVGAVGTMVIIWLTAWLIRRKQLPAK